LNWLTDRIRRRTQTPPPAPKGIVVCLDDLTYEQYEEDRPHLMRAADMGAFRYAANLTLPSGRTWRMDRLGEAKPYDNDGLPLPTRPDPSRLSV
jgi:hypothetical protein